MDKGRKDQERCFEQAREALADARWRMDIGRGDCLPDQLKWTKLEQDLGDLMFAAYARNHELSDG
jgi:hypothetical protein